jgi:hypothetical protein
VYESHYSQGIPYTFTMSKIISIEIYVNVGGAGKQNAKENILT